MNAVIDIGNTRAKIGLFTTKSKLKVYSIESEQVFDFLKSNNVDKLMLSNVGKADTFVEKISSAINQTVFFSINTPMPISTSYKTPQTLGVDRLAACVGARKYANGAILVIDAGTCITYDILSKENVHEGGIISPGIKMRLEAMHNFTSNLPLVSFEEVELVGNTTESCLQSGALNGAIAEMRGIIEQFIKKYEDLSIIIGGGDAIFFDKHLKLNTFVVSNLTLEGLYIIFKYNE